MTRTLPVLLALTLPTLCAGCFDEVTAEDFCKVQMPDCDSDGDGVLNGEDDFPLEAACSTLSPDDCFGCGQGCSGHGECVGIGVCLCAVTVR